MSFAVVLAISWMMARIEGRRIADYGLPANQAFRGKFWVGAVIGFASITALVGGDAAVARFSILGPSLSQRAEIVKYAALWGLAFLAVAFLEEFFFRGYALFTATTGITFWPAAILSCIAFGYVHLGNSGENWLGVFNVGAVGFLFCLILRRTGSLWMAIGFHSAWDWGETYFYGVPDSGQVAAWSSSQPDFFRARMAHRRKRGTRGKLAVSCAARDSLRDIRGVFPRSEVSKSGRDTGSAATQD